MAHKDSHVAQSCSQKHALCSQRAGEGQGACTPRRGYRSSSDPLRDRSTGAADRQHSTSRMNMDNGVRVLPGGPEGSGICGAVANVDQQGPQRSRGASCPVMISSVAKSKQGNEVHT